MTIGSKRENKIWEPDWIAAIFYRTIGNKGQGGKECTWWVDMCGRGAIFIETGLWCGIILGCGEEQKITQSNKPENTSKVGFGKSGNL
jgi:hypothetical protein